MKEYDLKTPRTGPHGLSEDKDGNIWFTGNSAALIGKLDPKTGAVTEYPMPAPKARTLILSFSIATAFCGLRYSRPTW